VCHKPRSSFELRGDVGKLDRSAGDDGSGSVEHIGVLDLDGAPVRKYATKVDAGGFE
jgi:hypothetical protein